MVKKVVRKSGSKAETASKSTPAALDPFAEIADEPASKESAPKGLKAETREIKRVARRIPRMPVESTNVVISDAFAEPVTDSLPGDKSSKKTRRARSAKVVAAKSEPAATGVLTTGLQAEEPKAVATSPTKKKATKSALKTPVIRSIGTKNADLDITAEIAAAEPEVELSPVFKALADVSLPELEKENRARLLMQSPTRLYFYWSVRENPWQQLRKIFGDDLGSYMLVLKLTDLRGDSEQIHQCDAEGNWWFDVEPDGEYQAEIGFYAVNRPYFRVIYSNTIVTPRRSPSPRPASEARWTVSANKFAEVLDVAGFSRDAFDVAMAGDDHVAAQDTTHSAFTSFIGAGDYELDGISPEDIRYAMLALASGFTLEDLRWRVGPALFAILQANVDKLAADKALAALGEYFDIGEAEWTEEEFSAAVYGASLVHFPQTLKTKKVMAKDRPALAPKYNPISSHSLR